MAIKFITEKDINISGDVPLAAADIYARNYLRLTRNTGKLLMFVCDQKIEHLNDAFVGKNIHPDAADPEHMFQIADASLIGGMAAQPGLIARYGLRYPHIPYIVKLNSKTEASPYGQAGLLGEIMQVNMMRKAGLNVVGVGYSLYIGGENEAERLAEAAEVVREAHYNGFVAIVWVLHEEEVDDHEQDPHLLAGDAGVGLALGFDFVHLYEYVKAHGKTPAYEHFKEVRQAAGLAQLSVRTHQITDIKAYLECLYEKSHLAGIDGTGLGRAILSKSLSEAVKLMNATAAIILAGDTVETAMKVYITGRLSSNLKKVKQKYCDLCDFG